MSQIPGIGGGANTNTNSSGAGNDALGGLGMDHFLKLMITELQNQDPLNPMENSQLIEQIGQIRSVGATDKLTSTLDAVLLGQNVSSATNLIGKTVNALNDQGVKVTGEVDKVTIIDGQPRLHIGADQVSLSNVSEVSTMEPDAVDAV